MFTCIVHFTWCTYMFTCIVHSYYINMYLVYLQMLEALCNPILNKPKPKVEPPKEEEKKEEEAPMPQAGGDSPQKTNGDQQQPAAGEQVPSAPDMDLD